ncbi:hypothetical protein ABEB36_007913 [Hypothenemus hampei]|uniref:Uncharacterized protein n=1 Tax=Hypothenemus hampei TaxID=57062 RepID=A0ABD1EWK0_HYPHA
MIWRCKRITKNDSYLDGRRKLNMTKRRYIFKSANPKIISRGEKLETDEVKNWVSGNAAENEEFIFTDEDIIANYTTSVMNSDTSEDEEKNVNINAISHEDAVRYFSNCIQWAMENNLGVSEIVMLHQLQEKAASLRFKSQKQTTITDFFKHS